MLYLLDANVLITASKTYYEMERVPEFWDWLIYHGEKGNVKIPQEVYEEITAGRKEDKLVIWAKKASVKDALMFKEPVDVGLVQRVTTTGYAPDLSDEEFEELGRDPFLIAYGLVDSKNRTVVTTEISKPKRKRANRKIPDVCSELGVPCINTFALSTALNFSTGWRQ